MGAKILNTVDFNAAMEHIIAALKEKGYDPYAQLTGYITEHNITYITSHKGARQLIATLDIECVKNYVIGMEKS